MLARRRPSPRGRVNRALLVMSVVMAIMGITVIVCTQYTYLSIVDRAYLRDQAHKLRAMAAEGVRDRAEIRDAIDAMGCRIRQIEAKLSAVPRAGDDPDPPR